MSAVVLLVALAATTHAPIDCAQRPAACQRALRWQRIERAHLARENHALHGDLERRFAGTSTTAIRVACVTYNVSCGTLLRVARCESSLDPFARNGRYLGLFQLGGFHLQDPVIEASSPFDPYANALHTARYVSAHGWGTQWDCHRG